MPLSIGMISDTPSLLVDEINADASLPFVLSVVETKREEAFPWMTPLPMTLGALPDIVNPLVGYRYSDIPALVEQDVIEPLEPILAELGIDAANCFVPEALSAVTYKGHIWAIPFRAESLLLSYDRAVFERLGLKGEMRTWRDVLNAAKRVAGEAIPGKRIRGFSEGSLPLDQAVALLLEILEKSGDSTDAASSQMTFLAECAVSGVLEGDNAYRELAIQLQNLSTVELGMQVGVATLPPLAAIDSPVSSRCENVGFLECFALRKNSDRRLGRGKAFVKWLLDPVSQMRLVDVSRVNRRKTLHCHVPLIQPVQQSAEFKKLIEEVPSYRVLLDVVSSTNFTTPEESEQNKGRMSAYRQMLTDLRSSNIEQVVQHVVEASETLKKITSADKGLSSRDFGSQY